MSRRVFDQALEEALESLPTWVKGVLAEVAVVVADEDPDEPDLYGVYLSDPPRVVVFRRPLSEDFPDPVELRSEVRITVLHEIGHHFGMDEDRLDDLGYA
jgi:predicted Zn-dependent protease with MMP-like domain